MTYRRDIDGLRAVAVLSIVLYHFGASALSGGFVGVDVFFVISGFLITSLIAKDLETSRFVLSEFFMRRVRRLAPALFVTVAGTLALGHVILIDAHLEALGYSAIAAVLSVSNILFWTQTGYFDIAGSYKPLLHTWSLGVEEQFYLIWPACLLFLWTRLSLRRIIAVVCLVAVASLIGAVLVAPTQAETGFFLTPFRLYEFALGCFTRAIG